MARTTDDSEELLKNEHDENRDVIAEEDPKAESGSKPETEPEVKAEAGDETEKSPQDEPEEAAAEESVDQADDEPEGKAEKKAEILSFAEKTGGSGEAADETPGAEPENKKEAAPEIEPDGGPEEKSGDAGKSGPGKRPNKKSGKKTGRKAAGKASKKKKAGKSEDSFDDDSDDYDDYDDSDNYDDYDDEDDDDESEEGGMGLNLFTLFVLLIAASITLVYYVCTVRTVNVSGNSLYTSEEIAEKVISDDSQLRHNTVFLTALYMTPLAPKIPFEESVKVSLESYDTIRITVKDMDIAGFIPYAGKNLYFSADGIVLENSPLTVKNSTFVTGLSITGAETGKKMTAENEVGLDMVLEVLQILRKYQMDVECVVLTQSGSVVMYMDDIKVQLGRTGFELKISKIAQILPYLEGRSGTINMTNYTSADQNIILK